MPPTLCFVLGSHLAQQQHGPENQTLSCPSFLLLQDHFWNPLQTRDCLPAYRADISPSRCTRRVPRAQSPVRQRMLRIDLERTALSAGHAPRMVFTGGTSPPTRLANIRMAQVAANINRVNHRLFLSALTRDPYQPWVDHSSWLQGTDDGPPVGCAGPSRSHLGFGHLRAVRVPAPQALEAVR